MMSDHGENPIFFNKKIKTGRPEHSVTLHTSTSESISFLPFCLHHLNCWPEELFVWSYFYVEREYQTTTVDKMAQLRATFSK